MDHKTSFKVNIFVDNRELERGYENTFPGVIIGSELLLHNSRYRQLRGAKYTHTHLYIHRLSNDLELGLRVSKRKV